MLYPIHPTSAAEYRKIFRPSGAKSDGPDAALHLDLLLRHRDKLRPWNPDTPETARCSFWCKIVGSWWTNRPESPTD